MTNISVPYGKTKVLQFTISNPPGDTLDGATFLFVANDPVTGAVVIEKSDDDFSVVDDVNFVIQVELDESDYTDLSNQDQRSFYYLSMTVDTKPYEVTRGSFVIRKTETA